MERSRNAFSFLQKAGCGNKATLSVLLCENGAGRARASHFTAQILEAFFQNSLTTH